MVETVACPSCSKPIAVSVVRAGQKRCHHCGARLPEPAAERPAATKAPAQLRRPPAGDAEGAGSSPYWQAPAQLNILKHKKGVDSAGNMLPERPRSARPAGSNEERPVMLQSVAKPVGKVPPSPAAPVPSPSSEGLPLASLAEAVERSSTGGIPTLKGPAPQRGNSGTAMHSVRPARPRTNWAVPLGLVLGFSVTLAILVFFFVLRSR